MLRYLLNFWLSSIFLMFAAGATIDAGFGGGDGGTVDQSGGDAADAGDAGADGSSGADEGSQDDAGSEELDTDGQQDADASIDPDAPVDLGDGRQVPGKWKKLFDAAAKAGIGKEAKQLYFAQQRLAKAIPGGVNAAIELARSVEEMGGVEGIQQLQSDLETHTADAQLFESDPGKWAEQGFQENPESALKAFARSLDYVADNHPEEYSYYGAKIIINDLKSSSPVGKLYQFLGTLKDNPEAQKLAKELRDYYNSRKDLAATAPEKKSDAQNDAITKREAAVKKQEMDVRYKQVNAEVFPSLKNEVTKTLRSEAKASNLDIDKLSKEYPAEWRNMLNEIHQGIMKEAIKDQRFINKHHALVEKGDLKRAAKAVNDKHAAVAADVVRRVMGTYGVFRGKKTVKPGADKGNAGGGQGGQQPQNQGWASVSKRPENSAINWSKTTSAMQLDGKYILNDGKKVVVKY